MALCKCKYIYPQCEYHGCSKRADWTIYMPSTRKGWIREWPHGRFKFMCKGCANYYNEALSKPLKMIDVPENAPEDWKPSIRSHAEWGDLVFEDERRRKGLPPGLKLTGGRRPYTMEALDKIVLWCRSISNGESR